VADGSVVQAAHAKHMQDWYNCGRRHKPGRSSSSSGGSSSYSSSSSGGSGGGGGSYIVAPWWPGQCIDCSVVGSTADPTGTFCSKCVMFLGLQPILHAFTSLQQTACAMQGRCCGGKRKTLLHSLEGMH
jgi:hypothetical protein